MSGIIARFISRFCMNTSGDARTKKEIRRGSTDSIRAGGQNAPRQRPNTKLPARCTEIGPYVREASTQQGWQENQPVTFLTDGGDTARNMSLYMAPASEHLLDWFHITMRITVMRQYVKGLRHSNLDNADAAGRLLRCIQGLPVER